jgi:hypothetical protein
MRWIGILALLWSAFGLSPTTSARAQDVGGGQQGGVQNGDFGGLNLQSQDLNVDELMSLALDRQLLKEAWKDQSWDGVAELQFAFRGGFGDGAGEADTTWVDECDK